MQVILRLQRWFPRKLIRKYWACALVFACAMTLLMALLTPTRNWILTRIVEDPAASWAVQLGGHIDRFRSTLPAEGGADLAEASPEEERIHLILCTAIGAALRSGQIFQIDLIDPETRAHVSIGSFTEPNLLAGLDPHDWSDAAMVERIAKLLTRTAASNLPQPHPGQVPVLHADGFQAGLTAEPVVTLYEAAERTLPARYALVEVPDIAGGLTLRMAFDLEDASFSLTVAGVALAALVSLLISVSVFHALRAAHLSRQVRAASEAEVAYLAEHDPLTGALNRHGFETNGERLIQRCAKTGEGALLFHFDADKFKDINDTHGHAAGDLVLTDIAAMIRWLLPDDALVARMGGDEFCALVRIDSLGDRLERPDFGIPSELEISLDEERRRLTVRTSAGSARFPEDGETLDDLIHAADLALMNVKQTGRGRLAAYDRSMTTALRRRVWEIDGVRSAIGDGQIRPHYQPLICARTGRVEGLEALVRWYHPVLGPLAPVRFTSALNDQRIGPEITMQMIDSIVADLVRMREEGVPRVSIGLNLGEADFRNGELPDLIAARLDGAGLSRAAIGIEVTENSLSSSNYQEAREMLQRFRSNGSFVALDDFGTGTSSITLLKNLPCTGLKIDKSFVRNVLNDPSDQAIVTSLTSLGHELGFKIVAEGVEKAEQLELLRELGVDLVQGHYFSEAVALEEAAELIRQRNGPDAPEPLQRPDADAGGGGTEGPERPMVGLAAG